MGTLHTLAKTTEIAPGTAKCVSAGGKKLALFNVEGRFYAVDEQCNHRGGPLAEGELVGNVVTCPWHGAQFDVRTGAVLRAPGTGALKTYAVTVAGDMVQLEM